MRMLLGGLLQGGDGSRAGILRNVAGRGPGWRMITTARAPRPRHARPSTGDPMKSLALIVLLASLLAAPGRPGAAPSAQPSATPSDISAHDLASALNLRWWSYRLTFPTPVAGFTVRPCELRRGSDGKWQRSYLAPGLGRRHEDSPGFADIDIKLFLDDSNPGKYGLALGDLFDHNSFQTVPDFTDTYTSPSRAQFVDGCLALAIHEDVPGYPNAIMGEEKYMTRVIALEITTE